MKLALSLLALFLSQQAFAYQITSIKVSGEKVADLFFQTVPSPDAVPQLKITDNTIELTFDNVSLVETSRGKLDLESPHALVSRVEAANDGTKVRARILVNGGLDGLKGRVSVGKEIGGVRLKVQYPTMADAALDLMKEEQAPLAGSLVEKRPAASRMGLGSVLFIAIVFLGMGAAAFFALRFLKGRGVGRGTRKFLVEQVNYTPVGPGGKAGVSVLKIGRDFVLIGVTGNQVSFLSALPSLSEDHADDAKLERTAFKEAVEEEYKRLKLSPEVTA